MLAHLDGGGLSKIADTADGGDGGWQVSDKMMTLLMPGTKGVGSQKIRQRIEREEADCRSGCRQMVLRGGNQKLEGQKSTL